MYAGDMRLKGESTALLVQKALVLEPLADKSDCTTRFTDLPGRPLTNFVLAGINVGPVFDQFCRERLKATEPRLFHYFVAALKASNRHTSGKFVNFGLLEIMFPAVAARLACDNPDEVVPVMIDLMKQAPQSDVAEMVWARELAWSTSEKREAKLADLTPHVRAARSPYEFYERLVEGTPHGSTAEWVANYQAGLPLLADQFNAMRRHQHADLLIGVKEAYEAARRNYADIRVGILADMSAAATFLYLSFLPEEV